MGRWFRVYCDVLNDRVAQTMSGDQFKNLLFGCLRGETNELSRFVKPDPWSGRPVIHEWIKLRRTIFERDDFTCQYCGEKDSKLECDHILPVSKGGQTELDNLTTSCRSCNRSKGAKTIEGWQ